MIGNERIFNAPSARSPLASDARIPFRQSHERDHQSLVPSAIIRRRRFPHGENGDGALTAGLERELLGFLFERAEGIAGRGDALVQIRFQEWPEATETFVLGGVRQFVDDQSPISPAIGTDENAVPQTHPGRVW